MSDWFTVNENIIWPIIWIFVGAIFVPAFIDILGLIRSRIYENIRCYLRSFIFNLSFNVISKDANDFRYVPNRLEDIMLYNSKELKLLKISEENFRKKFEDLDNEISVIVKLINKGIN